MRHLISGVFGGIVLLLFTGMLIAGTTKQERDVGNFKSIKISGSGDVVLVQGSENKLVVETDENVLDHIETRVKNGTLILKQKDRFFKRGEDVTYYVTARKLEDLSISGSGSIVGDKVKSDKIEFSISGSGEITIKDLTTDRLDLSISGSGDIDLAGKATVQKIRISGSGNYLAKGLVGEYVDVNISGSGKAEVHALKDLTITSSGSSDIVYYGTPRITSSANGRRKVRQGSDSAP